MYFVKRGNQIVPADEETAAAFRHIEEGKPFRAQPTTMRSIKQNRWFHFLCKLVADNHEEYDTVEKVKTALKVATGFVDPYIGYNGKTYLVPRSTRFDTMSQVDFNRFADNCIHVITTRFLPGVDDADIRERIDVLMHGPIPEDPYS